MSRKYPIAAALAAALTFATAARADSGASTSGDWIHVAPVPAAPNAAPSQAARPRATIGLVPSQSADNATGAPVPLDRVARPQQASPAGDATANTANTSNADPNATDTPPNNASDLPSNRAPRILVIGQGIGTGAAQPTAVLTADQTPPDAATPADANHIGAAVSNSSGITRSGTGAGNSPAAGAGNTGIGTDQSGANAHDTNDPTTVTNSGGITRSGLGLGDTPMARRATWDSDGNVVRTQNGGAGEGAVVSSSGGFSQSGSGYGQVYSNGGYAGDATSSNVVSNSAGLTRSGDGTRGDPTVTHTFGMTPGLLGNRGR